VNRALLLDNDPSFIISAQKLFPEDTEWLATMNIEKAEELVDIFSFDLIIVRRKNHQFLNELIKKHFEDFKPLEQNPFKQIVVLPRLWWKGYLKRLYRGR